VCSMHDAGLMHVVKFEKCDKTWTETNEDESFK